MRFSIRYFRVLTLAVLKGISGFLFFRYYRYNFYYVELGNQSTTVTKLEPFYF